MSLRMIEALGCFLPVLLGVSVGTDSAIAGEKEKQVVAELTAIVADRFTTQWGKVEALRMIGRMGPSAADAVPALIVELGKRPRGRDQILQEEIIRALGRIGPKAKLALPSLARAAGQHIDIDLAVREATRSILRPMPKKEEKEKEEAKPGQKKQPEGERV